MTLQAALAKDVKKELETTLDLLSGKSKGGKGKAPRGAERRKMWEEVRALRKESDCYGFVPSPFLTHNSNRYRQREGGVVETVLSDSQVREFGKFVIVSRPAVTLDRSGDLSFFRRQTASESPIRCRHHR